jgi:alpha-tubulin suppressor-like RCC1 family protein
MPGSVFGWGLNDGGQLGNGTLNSSNVPLQVKGVAAASFLNNVKAISGGWQSLALASDGRVYAWGHNKAGQVGDGTDTDRTTPVQVVGIGGAGVLGNIKGISAGRLTWKYSAHSLALGSAGQVFAWGANEAGQLGDGTTTGSKTPVQVKDMNALGLMSNILEVSGGAASSLALAWDGKVFAWGANYLGQLGDGTNIDRSVPVQVKGVNGIGLLSNIKAVSASFHSLALRSDGFLFSWGDNASGQLGNYSNLPSQIPVQVASINNIVAISAGYQHSLALRSNGIVYAWGSNNSGQLGDGTKNSTNHPTHVKDVDGVSLLSNIVAVSAGYYESCALRADGTLLTWGDNSLGQLGTGNNNSSSLPVQVVGLKGVLAVSMGAIYGLALV